MGSDRVEVRNAADPKQVQRAERRGRDQRERRAWALKRVLSTVEGRLVLWELLGDAGVFRSIWHPSAAIHYNAGRQDFGHELMAAIIAVDDGETYALMQREMLQLAKREGQATDAAHTPRAGEAGAENNG